MTTESTEAAQRVSRRRFSGGVDVLGVVAAAGAALAPDVLRIERQPVAE